MDTLCDYQQYHLSGREWARYLLEGAGFCALTAYVFYRSIPVFLAGLPLCCIYPLMKQKDLRQERKEQLRTQFKEAVLMLASALSAGYSVENAFAASARDLEELYGEEGMITKEFTFISRQLQMNRTVEALLLEFAERSGVEEVRDFAEIFALSKRSRGELVSVVSHVVHVIGLCI